MSEDLSLAPTPDRSHTSSAADGPGGEAHSARRLTVPMRAGSLLNAVLSSSSLSEEGAPSSPHYTPSSFAQATVAVTMDSRQSSSPERDADRDRHRATSVASAQRLFRGLPQYEHVAAIVNPLSGERSASDFVYHSLCEELGENRVMLLTEALFRDPAAIKAHIRRYSVTSANAPGRTAHNTDPRRYLGTIVVAGGDGTVSFIMTLVDALATEVPPDRLMPAVGVIAMGTGNDLSNTLGFGLGYTKHPAPPCCCCCCCVHDVGKILLDIVTGDAVPLDRWLVTVTPIRELVTGTSHSGRGESGRIHFSGIGSQLGEKAPVRKLHTASSFYYGSPRLSAQSPTNTPNAASSSPPPTGPATSGMGSSAAAPPPPSEARSFVAMNYFSIGMDAFIATNFDRLRKKYPAMFRSRLMNKMWYGGLGLYGAIKSPRIDDAVFYIEVGADGSPVPAAARETLSGGREMDASPDSSPSDTSATPLPLPQVVAKFPPRTKALVMSNVTSYSGGGKLWKIPPAGKRRVNTPGVDPSTWRGAAIDDGFAELQALGGLVDMGLLQARIGSSDKIAQSSAIRIVVGDPKSHPRHIVAAAKRELTKRAKGQKGQKGPAAPLLEDGAGTPHFRSSDAARLEAQLPEWVLGGLRPTTLEDALATALHNPLHVHDVAQPLAPQRLDRPLTFQVDGEPSGSITVPSLVDIRPYSGRVLVRRRRRQ